MQEDSLQQATERVAKFCDERDWDQFHSPKDLAIGAITEASELLEIFRFKTEEEMQAMLHDPDTREHIGQELADVFYFLLRFAQRFDFDLLSEFEAKMVRNGLRYPVELARGSNLKASDIPLPRSSPEGGK
jgi:NTP pyrophosphatase (non-canonical NTP hydrolase)